MDEWRPPRVVLGVAISADKLTDKLPYTMTTPKTVATLADAVIDSSRTPRS
jgi:hypothetical protein